MILFYTINTFIVIELDVDHSNEIPGKGLQSILQSEKHCDVSFVVEGQVVRAHRVIVASQSRYFDRSVTC